MSEIYEFMMDADGNGTDDHVVAEEYADGSILTVADLDGDGLADVAPTTWTATGSRRRPTRCRAATRPWRPRRSASPTPRPSPTPATDPPFWIDARRTCQGRSFNITHWYGTMTARTAAIRLLT